MIVNLKDDSGAYFPACIWYQALDTPGYIGIGFTFGLNCIFSSLNLNINPLGILYVPKLNHWQRRRKLLFVNVNVPKCNAVSYFLKASDAGDISPPIFLDFPPNFRLRMRHQRYTSPMPRQFLRKLALFQQLVMILVHISAI